MRIQRKYLGAIFDLDGVIVDTAKYHFQAWKELADRLGFTFTEKDNEALKGVSRMASLDILLKIGELKFEQEEKERMAAEKNERYVTLLKNLDQNELLPGTLGLLKILKKKSIPVALGSASKNAPGILKALEITDYFDAIVDGNHVQKAKPNPEVFSLAAKKLGLDPVDCIVFEDAQAGIEAAITLGCYPVAVGEKENLKGGKLYIDDLSQFPVDLYYNILGI